MIKLDFTQKDIDELNDLRFYHPDRDETLRNRYDETFTAFKLGIDACLNDIDKKYQSQITSLMPLLFQVFKNNQVLTG